jgi:hypothetical protein
VHVDLDTLATALYVKIDDGLRRCGCCWLPARAQWPRTYVINQLEGVDLEVGRLVGGGDAGVAEQMAHARDGRRTL